MLAAASVAGAKAGLPDNGNLIVVVDPPKFGKALAEQSAAVQITLFFTILAMPFVGLGALLFSLRKRMSPTTRARLRRVAAVFPIIAFGLYGVYELGIPPYTDIRIDLLLIVPALGLAILVWPAVWLAGRSNRG